MYQLWIGNEDLSVAPDLGINMYNIVEQWAVILSAQHYLSISIYSTKNYPTLLDRELGEKK